MEERQNLATSIRLVHRESRFKPLALSVWQHRALYLGILPLQSSIAVLFCKASLARARDLLLIGLGHLEALKHRNETTP